MVGFAAGALGVDEGGLDEIDRRFLRVMLDSYNGGPVGIDALAASLNEDPGTIVDTIEPYLLKAGYVKRTSRGRLATRQAFEHFGLTYSKQKQEELF